MVESIDEPSGRPPQAWVVWANGHRNVYLFGLEHALTVVKAAAPKYVNEESAANIGPNSKSIEEQLRDVEGYSIRELREAILTRGGSLAGCVEKSDLRARLVDCICGAPGGPVAHAAYTPTVAAVPPMAPAASDSFSPAGQAAAPASTGRGPVSQPSQPSQSSQNAAQASSPGQDSTQQQGQDRVAASSPVSGSASAAAEWDSIDDAPPVVGLQRAASERAVAAPAGVGDLVSRSPSWTWGDQDGGV